MSEKPASPGTLRLRETEEKMRRALGLTDEGSARPLRAQAELPRYKRRFVSEGEIPVTVLPSSGRRQPCDEHQRLAAERHAREAAERVAAEAQLMVRDLRTRLAHAEIAVAEAQGALAAERHRAEAAVAALHVADQKIKALETAAVAVDRQQEAPHKTRRAASRKRERGAGAEPKPVRWWLKPRRKTKR